MANDYWFPCFVNDLLGSFSWRAMTNEERGAYWQLICYQMQTSDGMLPGEINVLNRLAELDLNEHPLVLAKFPETDCGKRANARALEVWTDKATKSEKARIAVQSRYERSTNVVRTNNDRSTDEVRTKNERTTNVLRTQVQRARVSESESESQSESKTRDPQTPKGARSRLDLPDGFAEFWSAYPRKVKKPDALKAWRQVAASLPDGRSVVKAVESWKGSESWTKDGGKFVPYPATWLRGECWNDAPDAVEVGTKAAASGVDVRFDELSEAQKQAIRERSGRI